METRAVSFCCAALAGASSLGTQVAAGDAALFQPMKQSCTRERKDYCNAVMPSDARLALCLYAHEDKLSVPCALDVYNGMIALQLSLSTLSSYAKTCRSDFLKLCASTKWGHGRLYNCLSENKEALTPECRSALNGARPELQQLGVVE